MVDSKINELLTSIYYDTKNSGSFGGVKKLFDAAREFKPNIPLSAVKQWLAEQLTYTLHKPVKRRFKRNRIIVKRIDHQWEADLVDMQEYATRNKNYNYILTIIDCFSKFAFAVPIKVKTAKNIADAFSKIFKTRIPQYIRTDKGKEFINSTFEKLLDDNKINFFTSKDERIKCAIVERFNRTLKERMFKYFTSKGTRKYIDVLQDFVDAYNSSYHRTIKMRPIDVTRENSQQVFKNIYNVKNVKALENQADSVQLKTGDKVRIQYEYKPFEKGYYPNWTDQIYTLDEPIVGDRKVVFRIKDYEGNLLEQKFYPEELQKITENLYRVEKILRKRTRKRIKECFVKWLNYPDSYNTWIPESNIKKLKDVTRK